MKSIKDKDIQADIKRLERIRECEREANRLNPQRKKQLAIQDDNKQLEFYREVAGEKHPKALEETDYFIDRNLELDNFILNSIRSDTIGEAENYLKKANLIFESMKRSGLHYFEKWYNLPWTLCRCKQLSIAEKHLQELKDEVWKSILNGSTKGGKHGR